MMEPKDKYIVIRRDNQEYLEEMVAFYMERGYKPQGGVCVYFDNRSSTTFYCQAVIWGGDVYGC